VADRLWLVDEGTVQPYEGDMDDYRLLLSRKGKPARAEGGRNKKDERRARAEERARLAAAG
jgi:ATP-binding cassette subfamily F protein 3